MNASNILRKHLLNLSFYIGQLNVDNVKGSCICLIDNICMYYNKKFAKLLCDCHGTTVVLYHNSNYMN